MACAPQSRADGRDASVISPQGRQRVDFPDMLGVARVSMVRRGARGSRFSGACGGRGVAGPCHVRGDWRGSALDPLQLVQPRINCGRRQCHSFSRRRQRHFRYLLVARRQVPVVEGLPQRARRGVDRDRVVCARLCVGAH
eukprot:Amastigsp_a340822_147.p5 type:complete len:140 gc:universal Amastigsp_a340822_147:486-905(+)